ncbi:MAG TPA: type II secretion system protein GspJ [Verrucomicrobiae bacterium]
MKIKLSTGNDTRAFTLIELILAVGVSAIVMIAINAVFFTALHLREVTSNAVDSATPTELAFSTMRRDLQCAIPPRPNGILSGDFKVGNVTTVGISQPVAIEVFTATGALQENTPWGDVQRVTYALKDPTTRTVPGKDLIRSVTRNLLSVATPEVDEQWMMSGVEKVEFLCYDGMQWSDAWDTTDVTTVKTNLPLAVRVRIQLAGNGANSDASSRLQPIEMLVPLDSQSRTNRTATGS